MKHVDVNRLTAVEEKRYKGGLKLLHKREFVIQAQPLNYILKTKETVLTGEK